MLDHTQALGQGKQSPHSDGQFKRILHPYHPRKISSPVLGLHSVSRLTSGRFCRVCLGTGDFLRPQGAIPPGLYSLRGGWVYCLAPEAPQKGECRRGRRYFWPCRTRVGFGPATGPTLKTALCHIRALVGRNDKYRERYSGHCFRTN